MLPYSETFDAIGTKWHIDSLKPFEGSLLAKIHACIEQYDKTYSRFRRDSLVTQMAAMAGTYQFSNDCVELMSFYRTLYEITDGKVTPLIGDALDRAGYDADYSLKPRRQIPVPAWDDVMKWNESSVTTAQPITLDIGAAGKGHLIDKISQILDGYDHRDYVIDASGDLIHRGQSKNVVGLEHPLDPTKIIGTVSVRNTSLCASANNKRAWADDLHHVFNPHTLQPAREIIATWVIADSTMAADGIATALFFASPETLLSHFDFHYVRMHSDGSLDYSPKFTGELFI